MIGELALLRDRKGREYMFTLEQGKHFSCTTGSVSHAAIAQAGAGAFVSTQQGERFLVQQPDLEQYCLHMKRQATPAYPKDAQTMAAWLNLKQGSRVLEAGSGSGALTLHLAKAVGSSGTVVSVEHNPKHQAQAIANVERFGYNCTIKWMLGKLEEVGLEGEFDGLALDLMEPWAVLPAVLPHVRAGAYVVCYLPNITQVVHLLEHITQLPLMQLRTTEVVWRNWTIKPPVAHPAFVQTGHTAFLVQLVKLA